MSSNSDKGRGRGGGGRGQQSSAARGPSPQQQQSPLWRDYIREEEAREGVRTGKFVEGRLRVNPKSRKNAFVTVDNVSRDILVQDETKERVQTGHRNRAIHGDVVVLELLPEDEWPTLSVRRKSKVRGEGGDAEEDGEEQEEDEVDATLSLSVLARLRLDAKNDEAQRRQENKQLLWRPDQALLEAYRQPAPSEHWIDVAARRNPELPKQPVARVVFVSAQKHPKTLVGALEIKDAHKVLKPGSPLPEGTSYIFFQPHEAVYPKLMVPRMQLPEAFVLRPLEHMQSIFLADLCEHWPVSSKMAMGQNVRSLGEVGAISAETEALLVENCCNHGVFSDAALAPLKEIIGEAALGPGLGAGATEWQIPAEEISRRRDFRSHRIFTIDPSNAKDLDDALHATEMEDGTVEIGVHIADVSYFLQPGTALDAEAARRATSVYLVQKVVPMLPPMLCEHLCSLNPNVDRLTFSCVFRMEKDGTLSSRHEPWFGRSVIRSCAKLDYATAQRMVDGLVPSKPSEGGEEGGEDAFLRELPESVWEAARRPRGGHSALSCCRDVRLMHCIAQARRALRKDTGALTLFGTKLAFALDKDGNPEAVRPYPVKESNQLVEEYMLLANALVAGKLIATVGDHAFLRRHPPPLVAGLQEVKSIAEACGVAFDTTDARSLQESLNRITSASDPRLVQVVTALLMTPMKAALYLVAGSVSSEFWAHYALNIPYYTHFTSPIRRYADVCVHRLLDLALSGGASSLTKKDLSDLRDKADHCNEMKENAQKAQRRSDVVFLAIHIRNAPLLERGVVIGLGEKSFTVLVPSLGLQERIMIDEMPGVTVEPEEGAGPQEPASSRRLVLRRVLVDPITGGTPVAVNTTRNTPNTLAFTGLLELKIMTEVFVSVSAKMFPPPVDVCVTLVGPIHEGAQA